MSEQLAKAVASKRTYAGNMDLNCVLETTNPTLSVDAVAPLDIASIIVLREGEGTVAPWSLFQVTYGKATAVQEYVEWVPDSYQEEDAARERSPPEEEE